MEAVDIANPPVDARNLPDAQNKNERERQKKEIKLSRWLKSLEPFEDDDGNIHIARNLNLENPRVTELKDLKTEGEIAYELAEERISELKKASSYQETLGRAWITMILIFRRT